MSEVKLIHPILITSLGGSESLPVSEVQNCYVLYTASPITLNGGFTIAPSGVALDALTYHIKIIGDITLGTGSLVVFGRTITQVEITSMCDIYCYYDLDTTTWIISVVSPNNAAYWGKVYADSTDPSIGFLSAKVAKSIIENATTHKIELDGDILSPGANMVYGTDDFGVKTWKQGSAQLRFADVTLTHSDILQLNSVPFLAIPNPGVGYAIEIISASAETKNWTTAYTTNYNLIIKTDTATESQCNDIWSLRSTINRIIKIQLQDASIANATQTQIISNKAVYISVLTGDPDYGSGDPAQDLKVFITYRIITI